jgi:hypothetical protein
MRAFTHAATNTRCYSHTCPRTQSHMHLPHPPLDNGIRRVCQYLLLTRLACALNLGILPIHSIMQSTRSKGSRASNKQTRMTKVSAAIWLARGSGRRKPWRAAHHSLSNITHSRTSLTLEYHSVSNITQSRKSLTLEHHTAHRAQQTQRTARSAQHTNTQGTAHSAQRTAAHSCYPSTAVVVLLG